MTLPYKRYGVVTAHLSHGTEWGQRHAACLRATKHVGREHAGWEDNAPPDIANLPAGTVIAVQLM